MKEIYHFREGHYKIYDPEIGIQIDADFTPLFISADFARTDGLVIEKNEAGDILKAYFEVNGELEGEFLRYYPEGKIESECYYAKGKLHGPSRFYSEQGVCLSETWFYFNEKEGKAKRYYLSGKLYSVERYLKGSPHSNQEYYFENGTLKTIIPYKEGVIDGLVQLFWPTGAKKRVVMFKKGLREGFDRVWNEQGILIDEGKYEEGKPIGLHRRFYENGTPQEERHYYTPIRFDRKEWDTNGALCLEGKYDSNLAYIERKWQEGKELVRSGEWDGKRVKWGSDG